MLKKRLISVITVVGTLISTMSFGMGASAYDFVAFWHANKLQGAPGDVNCVYSTTIPTYGEGYLIECTSFMTSYASGAFVEVSYSYEYERPVLWWTETEHVEVNLPNITHEGWMDKINNPQYASDDITFSFDALHGNFCSVAGTIGYDRPRAA